MKNDFYDTKIIILDLNFQEMHQQNIDEYLYTKKLLKELSAHQNIIITTDNPKFLAIKYIEKLGLRTGYLISDSGSTVTNIADKQAIDVGRLDKELVIHLCNSCAWNNLHFSIITDTSQYPFNMSVWLIHKYQSDLSHINNYMENNMLLTTDIKETMKNKEANKLEIYFLNKDIPEGKRMMAEFMVPFHRYVDYSFNSCCLNVLPKHKTKLDSVKRVMKELNLNLNLNKDSIYFGLNQFDVRLKENAGIYIVSREVRDQQNQTELNTVSAGNLAWIKWFYSNEHLWHGELDTKLEATIKRHKDYTYDEEELDAFKRRELKFLILTREHANKGSQMSETVNLYFWDHQIDEAVALVKKYLSKDKS